MEREKKKKIMENSLRREFRHSYELNTKAIGDSYKLKKR